MSIHICIFEHTCFFHLFDLFSPCLLTILMKEVIFSIFMVSQKKKSVNFVYNLTWLLNFHHLSCYLTWDSLLWLSSFFFFFFPPPLLTGTSTTGTTSKGSSSQFSRSSGGFSSSMEEVFPDGKILPTPNLRIFSFTELKTATRNFRPDVVLGEGGFGKVYKGWIDEKTQGHAKSGSGKVIAVKKLNSESLQGLEEWQVLEFSSSNEYLIAYALLSLLWFSCFVCFD